LFFTTEVERTQRVGETTDSAQIAPEVGRSIFLTTKDTKSTKGNGPRRFFVTFVVGRVVGCAERNEAHRFRYNIGGVVRPAALGAPYGGCIAARVCLCGENPFRSQSHRRG